MTSEAPTTAGRTDARGAPHRSKTMTKTNSISQRIARGRRIAAAISANVDAWCVDGRQTAEAFRVRNARLWSRAHGDGVAAIVSAALRGDEEDVLALGCAPLIWERR